MEPGRNLLSWHGIEHENPVVLLAVRRRHELLNAFVGILTDSFPSSVARIIPLGFDLRAVELVNVDADALAARGVGDYEVPIFRPCRDETIRAVARLGGQD